MKNVIFSYFAHNIDCEYMIGPLQLDGSNEYPLSMFEAVLTSTHNLCFRAKLRKKMYTPVHASFTV